MLERHVADLQPKGTKDTSKSQSSFNDLGLSLHPNFNPYYHMRHFLLTFLLFLAGLTSVYAQLSDNGDGTFTNPVIWTDMPDPDVIQVGDTFYMVSTSMHMLPGVTLLKSVDLVNWSFATNVVPQFDDDPYFDLQGGNRYGKGQWATALRHWGGEYHVLFTSNTNGTFIYSSATMQGPWRKTTLYAGSYHPTLDRTKPLIEQPATDAFAHHILYDPGFLVDHDGRVYVVHGNTHNYITELDPVTCQAKTPARLLYQAHREGLEGNRPYHIGDYYYIICTYGGSHSGNVTCMRSRSLEGPWEEREVMCAGARMAEAHILQACLIPLESGETWAMAFMDMGVLGRIPHLVPVHWMEGWPVFGGWEDGNITLRKPCVKSSTSADLSGEKMQLAMSDDFSGAKLGLQWQFNHNPDWSKISLTERQGWLRLHAQRANLPLPKKKAGNPLIDNENLVSKTSVEVSGDAPMLMARNTLTQRLFGPYSQGTAKVDVSHLKPGDKAGLALLNIPYATLTISRTRQGFTLAQTEGDNEKEQANETVSLTAQQAQSLWLRVDTKGQTGEAQFTYSLDGKTFEPLGKSFQMVYSGVYFVGNRYALFCYNTETAKGGYMDVDDFEVEMQPLFDRTIKKGSTLEAEWTDMLWRAELAADGSVAYTQDGGFIAFTRLKMVEDIQRLTFYVQNINGNNTFVELRDVTVGKTLGSVDIPAPTGRYEALNIKLSQPLPSDHRLEVRIWNHDWDQPAMGLLKLDKIVFE